MAQTSIAASPVEYNSPLSSSIAMAAQRTQLVTDDCDSEARRLQFHKKTQLCKFFAVGACSRGSSCAFAHGKTQLRDQPDFSKTRLCADFMELGECKLGENCKFAHGRRELRPGSAAKVGRPSARSAQVPSPVKPKAQAQEAQAVMQALETLRKRQLHHERAALNLMLQRALPSAPPMPGKCKVTQVGCEQSELLETSFSRQTTWEGVEILSTGFSRASSDASNASSVELRSCTAMDDPREPSSELPHVAGSVGDSDVQVKNTFIHIQVDDEEFAAPAMRRTKSLPSFTGL